MDLSPQQNEYRQQRLANMEKLCELGYRPFGRAFERTGRLAEIAAAFQEHQHVRLAGRVMAKREMGKSVFAHLQDGSGRLQVYLKKDAVGDAAFEAFRYVDLGDHIGCEGDLFLTKTGEETLKITAWTLLSKSLRPMPEKWHGLQDVEARYRYRYLDLIANPASREVFNRRIAVIAELRRLLAERGFIEVETPMMQPLPGGATATPFKTHYNALNIDMYLRIAPELYLKRLLVGGFDKIFELNRNFRNEGLDRSHNPEFTMLEIYEAYGDVRSMMRLVQDLILGVAQKVCGGLKLGQGETEVDLTPPWRTVTYREMIESCAGADWFRLDLAAARQRAESLGLRVDPAWSLLEVTHEVYEKIVEKSIRNPTFVTRFPAALIPLAKPCDDDPAAVDVFELVILGREIAPAYSELNDPILQRQRLEAQAGGDASKLDEDFLFALEHGMPPAGGMGVGIDRLVMVLTGADAIRDVILFPQLKPKG
jgi:lysyl-tRNA synthetase class 2